MTLHGKLEKGLRARRLCREAQAQVAAARDAGRTGLPVLVTQLAQMGDVVLAAGVAAVLRERLPQSPFVFACQPRWTGIVKDDPLFDGVLGAQTLYEVRALARLPLWETVYVLDIPIPTLLRYLDGVPAVFRYAPPTTADWFTQGRHLMALYEQNAGLPEGSARPRVWRSLADGAFAATVMPNASPCIALHVHSSMAAKNWPPERFAELIARGHARRGTQWVILGGPGEASELAGLPGVTLLTGQLTVPQAAAVIAWCDFFVGPDSGLAYVAEAVGTPGLVILGATVPETSGPRATAGSPAWTFMRAPGACVPACHRECVRAPLCITHLTVDAVDDALERALARQEALCASP